MKAEEKKVWLGRAELERRYDRSRAAIDNWLKDPQLGFPRPRYFRGKRLWHIDELDAFDQRKLAETAQSPARPQDRCAARPA